MSDSADASGTESSGERSGGGASGDGEFDSGASGEGEVGRGESGRAAADADGREYPLGLASWQLFVVVVLGGLVLPGVLVYLFEEADLPVVADVVWVVGYGTAVLVVWVVWIRPLDFERGAGDD